MAARRPRIETREHRRARSLVTVGGIERGGGYDVGLKA